MAIIDWALSRGVIYSKDRIYVLAYLRNEESTRVFRWTNKWDNYYVPFSVRCISSLSSPNPEIITMSALGEIHSASPDGFEINLIDDSSEAPRHRGELRYIKCVGHNVYAVGIGRQVYYRDSQKKWSRFDQGILDPLGSTNIVGFESIDGYNDEEIYAVGLNGEIWFYNKSDWCKVESPTNLTLHKVLCAPNGKVYAAGRSGIILCGRRTEWKIIKQDVIDDVFWDLAWFGGYLYLSTNNSVFILKGELEEVDFLLEKKPTCGYLDANDGVICSIGSNDIVIFESGNWKKLPSF